MKYFFPILVVFIGLSACAKKKAEKQAAKDDEIIQEFIALNNLDAVATGSGLYYVINDPGNGDACHSHSTVKVAYTGYFTYGGVFDQSSEQGVVFPLQSVIQGWTEGIPYFKEGGSGTLLVPSALAYGPEGSATIPPNAVLIFDIELLDVL